MRTHRFEPVSLVFGLIFAGVGVVFLQADVDLWRVDWTWFWPAALTLSGLLVLLSLRAESPRKPATGDEPESGASDPDDV